MANKVIRDYTPGVNDFLHFAQVMNKNAEMDLQKSRAVQTQSAGGVTMPTAPVGAEQTAPVGAEQSSVMDPVQKAPEVLTGPQAYAQIQSNFKRALQDSANGIDTGYKNYFGGKV